MNKWLHPSLPLVFNCCWKLLSYLESKLIFSCVTYTWLSLCWIGTPSSSFECNFFFFALNWMFIRFPFQKKRSIMNSSVLHNLLVTFFLFKLRCAGQSTTLNDYEYWVVNNYIFWLIGLAFFWNWKHLAYSLTECPSHTNNAFIRICVKNGFFGGFLFPLSSTLESIFACK